jgi:hypothetical protein
MLLLPVSEPALEELDSSSLALVVLKTGRLNESEGPLQGIASGTPYIVRGWTVRRLQLQGRERYCSGAHMVCGTIATMCERYTSWLQCLHLGRGRNCSPPP